MSIPAAVPDPSAVAQVSTFSYEYACYGCLRAHVGIDAVNPQMLAICMIRVATKLVVIYIYV